MKQSRPKRIPDSKLSPLSILKHYKRDNFLERLFIKEEFQLAMKFLSSQVSKRNFQIFLMRFNGWTQKEIGKANQISAERVRNIENKCFRTLRSPQFTKLMGYRLDSNPVYSYDYSIHDITA